MFGFLRTSRPRAPSAATRRALEDVGLLAVVDAYPPHHVVQLRGRYAGRAATYLRVFDRVGAATRGLGVRAYRDLDAHPDLVLATGRIEADGDVRIDRHAPSAGSATPARARGDRAAHADDERFVFPDSVDAASVGRKTG